MRLGTLAVLLSLWTLAGTAVAQDAPPEAGATEAAPAEGAGDPMAGDMGGEAAPAEASAEAPAEEMPADGGNKPISAGLLLGYGISLESGANAWGLGFGVGGGYTLDMGVYLGARFVYYLGESHVNVWELGIEGGYDVDMDKLHIRPGIGLGIANVTVDIPAVLGFGGGSASSSEFFIAPGAALLYDVSDSIFIGVDARLQVVLASGGSMKGILLLANGGMRF